MAPLFRVVPPSAFFAVATRSAEAQRRGGGGQLQRGRMSRCDVPRLLSWARDNGVRLHPSVEVRATADRGLGVFASGPLAAGVPILSVPSGLLLSPLRAAPSQTPPSLAAVREQIARLSATLTLRLTDELALIVLLLRREGARSWWSPWLDCLPGSFDNTLQWSEAELRELQASRVVEWTRQRNASAGATLERLQRAWAVAGAMPDAMAPSREEWEWGLAVVWSRSFGMPLASGGGTAPILMPVSGMFNGAAYPARLVQRLHAAGELAFPPDAPFEVPPPRWSRACSGSRAMPPRSSSRAPTPSS